MIAVTRDVKRKATDAEIAVAARDLVALLRERDEKEAAFKREREEHKSALEMIDGQASAARETIEQGEVTEHHECSLVYHPDEARAVVARLDNGEILEERAMTVEELNEHRQLSLAPAPPPDNVEAFPREQCADCRAARPCPTHQTDEDPRDDDPATPD
jgi:hypothetical protein